MKPSRNIGLQSASTQHSPKPTINWQRIESQGHYGEASGCLREAARLDPGNAANWIDLGIACLQLKDHREAVACLQRSLKIQPADRMFKSHGHILFTNA